MSEEYTLVVSDIHEKYQRLRKIFKRYDFIEKKIIAGDWVDARVNRNMYPREHLEVLRDLLEDPNVTYLVGNHDMQYLFPHINALGCSGWSLETEDAFHDVLKQRHKDKMLKLHTWVQTTGKTWLVSHAGIHPSKAIHPIYGGTVAYIDQVCDLAVERMRCGEMNHMFACGASRGGDKNEIGGMTWLHWGDFEPIEGINQIVGHTAGSKVRTKGGVNSLNYCIDTHLENVCIIEPDGNVIIENIYHVD